MILSSGGCKVSWALRGGTGNAALASADRRLAGGIQTANPPTDNGDFQKSFFTHRRPSPERKSKFSLRLVHAELCGFIVGTGDARGCVTIVSMVTIFLTPVVSLKYRHDRHHRHGEGWMRLRETILPEWVRAFW